MFCFYLKIEAKRDLQGISKHELLHVWKTRAAEEERSMCAIAHSRSSGGAEIPLPQLEKNKMPPSSFFRRRGCFGL